MHIDDEFSLDPDEKKRLTERWERLRASLPPLREAAQGEEPLFNVSDLEDVDE